MDRRRRGEGQRKTLVWLLLTTAILEFVPGARSHEGYCSLGRDVLDRQSHALCPLPVDDRSDMSFQLASPWQLPLRCLRPPMGMKTSTHCLYLAPTFRGQGLGILTSSETAASLVGARSVADEVLVELNQETLVPGPVRNGNHGRPAYAVQDIPGKGKGVIASRLIRKDEVFMIDFPALVADKAFMAGLPENTRNGALRRGLDGVTPETKQRVLDLAQSTNQDKLLDIFQTNTCSFDLGDGKPHMGLYPEVSRMNHACKPNAFYRVSSTTLTIEVAAYVDIHPGEEIHINYAFLGMPHKERREYLRENWGFKCSCPLCQASAEERQESDRRRMKIVETRDEIRKAIDGDVMSRPGGGRGAAAAAAAAAVVVGLATELVHLYEAEDLKPLIAEAREYLARAYLAMGALRDANEQARLALEGRILYRGKDSGRADGARMLLHKIRGEMKKSRTNAAAAAAAAAAGQTVAEADYS